MCSDKNPSIDDSIIYFHILTLVSNIAILFAGRHLHPMHSLVLRAFWGLPPFQDLVICQLVYRHTQRTTS